MSTIAESESDEEDPSHKKDLNVNSRVNHLLSKVSTSGAGSTETKALTDHIRNEFDEAMEAPDLDQIRIEQLLSTYESFVEDRDKLVKNRNEILGEKIDSIPLWGGKAVFVDGVEIPSENAAERKIWKHEYIDAMCLGIVSVEEVKKKMNFHLLKLRTDRKARSEQVNRFLELRNIYFEKHPDKKAKSCLRLLSKSHFAKAIFKKREKILIEPSMKLEEEGEENDLIEEIKENFVEEMNKQYKEAQTSTPPQAWKIYFEMMQRLKGMEFLGDIHRDWKDQIALKMLESENSIKEKSYKIQGEVNKSSGDLAPQARETFTEYLHYFSNLPPKLKLKKNLSALLINTELKLFELLSKSEEPEVQSSEGSRETDLFEQQKDNEFLRRTFQQIAAIIMSMGEKSATANKTQSSLVHEDKGLTQEGFEERQEEFITEKASEKSGISSTEITSEGAQTGLDVVSAIEETPEAVEVEKHSGGGVKASPDEEVVSKHQSSFWDMTRISGFKAWPPENNERYLRQILDDPNQHLTLTNNYFIISAKEAKRVLKERIVENLDLLPGNSAKNKKAYLATLFRLVDHSTKMDESYVRKIFSNV